MASVADIDLQFLANAACDERIATTASHFGFVILRMNVCFHVDLPPAWFARLGHNPVNIENLMGITKYTPERLKGQDPSFLRNFPPKFA
jgi:hypothetical protein